MVTTNCRIPIDAIGHDLAEPVHLTGSFQVLARVTMGHAADSPIHFDVSFDAAQMRGVGLKTGARYAARGTYRISDDLAKQPISIGLIGAFELLRHDPGDASPVARVLVIPFQVTVQTNGRITPTMAAPFLFTGSGGKLA